MQLQEAAVLRWRGVCVLCHCCGMSTGSPIGGDRVGGTRHMLCELRTTA